MNNLFNVITFGVVFVLMIIFELFSINFSSIFLIICGGIASIILSLILSIKKKEEGVC